MKFTGTKDYVATDDLKIAVNASIVLERPLLIKGEPGTGKTVLAEEVAKALGAPLLTWHIKSTTKAQQGLYEYDAVSRLRDSQLATSAPMMPITILPISPKPAPRTISPASQPAIAPITSAAKIPIDIAP